MVFTSTIAAQERSGMYPHSCWYEIHEISCSIVPLFKSLGLAFALPSHNSQGARTLYIWVRLTYEKVTALTRQFDEVFLSASIERCLLARNQKRPNASGICFALEFPRLRNFTNKTLGITSKRTWSLTTWAFLCPTSKRRHHGTSTSWGSVAFEPTRSRIATSSQTLPSSESMAPRCKR